MPFNVQEFRNKLVTGGARPSQFEMQITWPDALRGAAGVSAAEQDFRFLCQISEIPASTINHIAVPYFGRKVNYAGDRTFAPLTVTILNDEDFRVRHGLEAWSKAIADHSTTLSQFAGGNAASSRAIVSSGCFRSKSVRFLWTGTRRIPLKHSRHSFNISGGSKSLACRLLWVQESISNG